MAERKPLKVNIPFCTACVLLFFTLLSIHFTSGLYARYTTSGTAQDSARVAKFDVTHSLNGQAITQQLSLDRRFVPGIYPYNFTVINNSEVRVNCTITVKTTDNLPLELAFLNVPEGETITEEADRVYREITRNAYIPANTTAEYTLQITFPQQTATGANSLNGMFDIVSISVLTEQAD